MKFFITCLVVLVIGGAWVVFWPPYAKHVCKLAAIKRSEQADERNGIPLNIVTAARENGFSAVLSYANDLYLDCVKSKGISASIDSHVPFQIYP